jgi:hypothetical protein
MGRPRLYTTSVACKAAWRRRQGMAVRPHDPSAAAKHAASRARKQAAQDLASRACAAIRQALQIRARADQCWELYERIEDWSRDSDMPHRGPESRPSGLLAGASAHFYGVAAARVRRYRRALQRSGARQGHQRSPGVRAERRRRAPGCRACTLGLNGRRIPRAARVAGPASGRASPGASRVAVWASRKHGNQGSPGVTTLYRCI